MSHVEVGRVRCDTILTIAQYLQNKAKDTQPEVKLDWYVMKMSSTYVLTVDSEFSRSNGLANKIMTETITEVQGEESLSNA